MTNPCILITGASGQDGYWLSTLHQDTSRLYGVVRRSSVDNTGRLAGLKINLIEGDVTDASNMARIINELKPDIIYNMAAQSHVATSFAQPQYTFLVNTIGPLNILEAIVRHSPHTRLIQASTSEMFGSVQGQQDEQTKFLPVSPYACSKLAAHHLVQNYRSAYGLHASCAIMFNHESHMRGRHFVTQKIVHWIGNYVKRGFTEKLKLGNLNAYRDWGHAYDYMRALRKMAEASHPDDYVIATGQTYTVRYFLEKAAEFANIKDIDSLIEIDESLKRPNEVPFLLGNSQKIRQKLGWRPTYDINQLIKEMVDYGIHGHTRY